MSIFIAIGLAKKIFEGSVTQGKAVARIYLEGDFRLVRDMSPKVG